MGLASVAATPAAVAMIDAVSSEVGAWEVSKGTRGNRRAAVGQKKLARAVGAVVGGVLRRWRKGDPQASYRAAVKEDFTGGVVPFRQFTVAVEGLVAVGYLDRLPGGRYGNGWDVGGDFEGYAPRLRPTARLLDVAEVHGIEPDTVRAAFMVVSSTKPRKITPKAAITLRTLTRGRKASIPIPLGARERGDWLRADVAEANAFALEHTVEGCDVPSWRRLFDGSLELHGRWYAAGENAITTMPAADRLAIRIDGEPVVEIDVGSSHLTLAHGLAGVPLPEGDLYATDCCSRGSAKAWIVGTLGKGSPVTVWATKDKRGGGRPVPEDDAKAVGAAMLGRFPFLADPAALVPERLASAVPVGFAKRARRGAVLTFYLMGLEAEAMTRAVHTLRNAGVLALPIHDSLIVPATAEGIAMVAMRAAFLEVAAVEVRLTVARLP